MKKILTTTLTLATFVTSLHAATLLDSWEFSETAGTPFSGLTNDSGTAAWTGDKAQVVTDNSGNIVYSVATGDGSDTNNVFRNATISGGAYSTGSFHLDYTISSALLTAGDVTGASLSFGVRAGGTDLFAVRLQKQNDNYLLQTRIGGSNTTLENFGAVGSATISNLMIHIEFDLDTDLMNVTWSNDGAGNQTSSGIAITDGAMDAIRMASNTNSNDMGTGDNIKLNSLSLSIVPEPSSTALLGLGGLALMLRRRR